MSDHQAQPPGEPEPRDRDPWAPPESGPARSAPSGIPSAPSGIPGGWGDQQGTAPAQPSPHVHDQPTMAAMPSADQGSVPPPPIAPGGPAHPSAGPYGYPAAGGVPPAAPGDPYGGGYPGYGYPGYPQTGWQQPATPQNGLGITAMVLGILSVCLFCLYGVVGIILGILALIFGILGRKRVKRGEATNGGMALSGIILGVVGIVLGAVFIALLVWGVVTAINEEKDKNNDWDSDYSNSLLIDNSREADPLTGLTRGGVPAQ
ncbi:DUF4190 domain-containing protein [Streptomyces sp. NPDC055078]